MNIKIKEIIKKIMTSPLLYILIMAFIFQNLFYRSFEQYSVFFDTESYFGAAEKNIFKGEVHESRTPVFPYFCKIISFVGGKEKVYSNIVLVHKLLFFISIILFYYSLKRITKSKMVYIIGTLIYSISPFLFMWNTTILTESLSIIEMVLLLFLTVSYLKKPKKLTAAFIGMQTFIMVMTRPAYIYLIGLYFIFWLIRLFMNMNDEEKPIVRTGFVFSLISIVLTLLYCNLVRLNYGEFSLTSVKQVNNTIIMIDSNLYSYGENDKITKDIDSIYIPGYEYSAWLASNYIMMNYTRNDITMYIKKSFSNAKEKYLVYFVKKAISIMPNNLGTIYSVREQNYSAQYYNNIAYLLFPVSFALLYIILFITFIYLIYRFFVKKKIEWTIAALFTIIFGNVFISIISAPYETQRLCVNSIPVLIVLISYFISIICKKHVDDSDISSKEKKKIKEMSAFGEFIYYIKILEFKKLFRTKSDNTFIQFFRYLFVGGIAAVVNIGLLYVLTDFAHLHYIISNIISFIAGLVVNYILSKKFVFQEKTKISRTKEFIIYSVIGVLGLGIDTLLMWVFTDCIGIYYMISKIISTMVVFIWNFGARKVLYKIIK